MFTSFFGLNRVILLCLNTMYYKKKLRLKLLYLSILHKKNIYLFLENDK
jgi:hypothetical protein